MISRRSINQKVFDAHRTRFIDSTDGHVLTSWLTSTRRIKYMGRYTQMNRTGTVTLSVKLWLLFVFVRFVRWRERAICGTARPSPWRVRDTPWLSGESPISSGRSRECRHYVHRLLMDVARGHRTRFSHAHHLQNQFDRVHCFCLVRFWLEEMGMRRWRIFYHVVAIMAKVVSSFPNCLLFLFLFMLILSYSLNLWTCCVFDLRSWPVWGESCLVSG